MTMDERHETNRLSWNVATRVHNSHKRDQAAFLKNGGTTLFPEELDLLGPLNGLSLLHLQCNSGQDSLCLARAGAEVTGVDISDTAIEFAEKLSSDSGIDASFERADVLDWLPTAAADGRRFDLVFASYGVIQWISEIGRWAEGIASVLRPGGRFVLVEFHPVTMIFDETGTPLYPYSHGGQAMKQTGGVTDYVGRSADGLSPSGFLVGQQDFENPHPSFEFCRSLADVLQAVLDAKLILREFREYPYANGCRLWNDMRVDGARLYPSATMRNIPMMFGLSAMRPVEDFLL